MSSFDETESYRLKAYRRTQVLFVSELVCLCLSLLVSLALKTTPLGELMSEDNIQACLTLSVWLLAMAAMTFGQLVRLSSFTFASALDQLIRTFMALTFIVPLTAMAGWLFFSSAELGHQGRTAAGLILFFLGGVVLKILTMTIAGYFFMEDPFEVEYPSEPKEPPRPSLSYWRRR